MCSIKMQLRNNIIDIKENYNNTKEPKYAIQAAIVKGVYKGIGGQKAIALPPYCTNIHIIMEAITKAKLKFGDDTYTNTSIIVKEFRSIFNKYNIYGLKLSSKKNIIYIQKLENGQTEEYSYRIECKNENLAHFGLFVDMILENLSPSFHKLLVETITTYLYSIDRKISTGVI